MQCQPPDERLVAAVLKGDTDAYAGLVDRYERAVRAVTTAVLRNVHLAQDAAQDAFVTAFEKLGTLRDPARFGPWVMRIARREAAQTARRARRHQSLTDAAAPITSERNGYLDDDAQALLEALVRLPEHERVVVILRYFDDHSMDTISTLTGRPVGTITKQLSRARARLARWLKEEPE